MTRSRLVPLIMVMGLGIAWGVVLTIVATAGKSAAEERLNEYCQLVAASLQIDATSLTEGATERQKRAVQHLDGFGGNSSAEEIKLCGGKIDYARLTACLQGSDYECLTKIVTTARRTLSN